VPKTSGQGVSRLAYQQGRALGNRSGFGNTEVSSGSTPRARKLKAPDAPDAAESSTIREMSGDEERKGKVPKNKFFSQGRVRKPK